MIREQPALYSVLMGLAAMATVPADIRVFWQWALGFLMLAAAAIAARRLRRRVSRVMLIGCAALFSAVVLDLAYPPTLPAKVEAEVDIYVIVNTSRFLVAFVTATIIALVVDLIASWNRSSAP